MLIKIILKTCSFVVEKTELNPVVDEIYNRHTNSKQIMIRKCRFELTGDCFSVAMLRKGFTLSV